MSLRARSSYATVPTGRFAAARANDRPDGLPEPSVATLTFGRAPHRWDFDNRAFRPPSDDRGGFGP